MVDWGPELDSIEQQIGRLIQGSDLPPDQRSSLRESIYGLSYDCPNLLYDKYREIITRFITIKVLPSITGTVGDLLLNQVIMGFEDLMYGMRRISGYFRVMDKVANEKNLPSLKEVVIICFRELVFDTYKVLAKDSIMQLIEREREGETIERSLVEYSIAIFVDVGLGSLHYYIDDFENHLIANCKAYCNKIGSRWLSESPVYLCKETLVQLEVIAKEEDSHISCYLHVSSEQNIIEIVRTSLLAAFSPEWIQQKRSVFRSLFKENKVEELACFYRLFSENDDILDELGEIFRQYICDQGVLISMEIDGSAQNFQDAKVYIWKIAELYERCLDFLTNCFMSDSTILMHASSAFRFFTNGAVKTYTAMELLHSCINDILSDRNAKMDKLLTISKLVKHMDNLNMSVFYNQYRCQLAIRLLRKLTDHDENLDNEKQVLENILFASHRMKAMVADVECCNMFTCECKPADDMLRFMVGDNVKYLDEKRARGNIYFASSKMKQMVADIACANDLCHQLSSNDGIEMELNVTVLNAFNWPNYRETPNYREASLMLPFLPENMIEAVRKFDRMFESRYHLQRKLEWDLNVGSFVLDLKFDEQVMELEVSPAQAAILSLFNYFDKMSYSDIRDKLCLSETELEIAICPLSCGEYEVLSKHPRTNEVSKSDQFEFNSKFTHPSTHIKVIPQPSRSWICKHENLEDPNNYKVRSIVNATILHLMKRNGAVSKEDLRRMCVESLPDLLPDLFKLNRYCRWPLQSGSEHALVSKKRHLVLDLLKFNRVFEPELQRLRGELIHYASDDGTTLLLRRKGGLIDNVGDDGTSEQYCYLPDW